jgi:hypothetical protein
VAPVQLGLLVALVEVVQLVVPVALVVQQVLVV